jgi:hypothetical protein
VESWWCVCADGDSDDHAGLGDRPRRCDRPGRSHRRDCVIMVCGCPGAGNSARRAAGALSESQPVYAQPAQPAQPAQLARPAQASTVGKDATARWNALEPPQSAVSAQRRKAGAGSQHGPVGSQQGPVFQLPHTNWNNERAAAAAVRHCGRHPSSRVRALHAHPLQAPRYPEAPRRPAP